MEDAPLPIPSHVVVTVFQYVLPPALPIPKHLLSRALLERHQFLSIDPDDDPVSYLCWPSSTSSSSEQLLRALENHNYSQTASDDLSYSTFYSAPDKATFLAHILPAKESRFHLVFSWDAVARGWKYHDTRWGSPPSDSTQSLSSARKKAGLHDDADGDSDSEMCDEDYWAGYGSSSSPPTPPINVEGPEDAAEAAYWASYGAIQGSGDSTVPSPMPEKAKETEKRPVVTDQGITPRRSDSLSPQEERQRFMADPLLVHLHSRLADDQSEGSPQQREWNFPYEEDTALDYNRDPPVKLPQVAFSAVPSDEADEAAREGIGAIYRLWKLRRSGPATREEFLSLIYSVLS